MVAQSTSDATYVQLTLLLLAVFGMLYFFIGFCQGKIRRKVFNKEFMSQFNKEHQEAFGCDAPVGGHPDNGNGYYADKLSYADWYVFNNWQRAHINFLETFAPVVVMIAITAINQPAIAAYSMAALIVGRLLYAIGYCKGGPKGRVVGAIITDLGLLAALVGAIWSLATWETSDNISGNAKVLPISQEKFESLFPAPAK